MSLCDIKTQFVLGLRIAAIVQTNIESLSRVKLTSTNTTNNPEILHQQNLKNPKGIAFDSSNREGTFHLINSLATFCTK